MRIMDINLKTKVLVLALGGILLVTILIAQIYIRDIAAQTRAAVLEKSRGIAMTLESARDAMAERLAAGVITDLETLAAQGDRDRLLQAVPIIAAIQIAAKNAEAGQYEFRVPKSQSRNPENEPVDAEIEALKKLEGGALPEYVVDQAEQIRYFRPIKLTEECLYCHGDPAGESDPTGGTKEGWKVGEVHGAFEIISSLDQAKRIQAVASLNIVLFAALGMALLGGGLFFLVRIVLKPLAHYVEVFRQAATGDLTVRARIEHGDEVGRVAGFFNEYIRALEGMVREVKSVTEGASEISSELAASSEETAASLTEIRANTQGMKDKIVRLDGEVGESARSAAEVKEFIGRLAELIANQASAINESSASIEEMSASIHNIAEAAEEKLRIANELESSAQDGQEEMEETERGIKKVADSASVILEMIQIIQDIASTTNLLAMNAAIEAAHAGDFGKGFAVVADEIRNLAESSSESAKAVTDSLGEVADFIKSSEASTRRTGEVFSRIVGQIKSVAFSMSEMKSATSELSIGAKQILEALASLITTTEEVRSSSRVMSERVGAISAAMSRVSDISADTKNGMEEIAIGIAEIFKAAEAIAEAGTRNSESVKHLRSLVGAFRVAEDAGAA